eukprot:m.49260 g.49260  ORF g.49260 m.49260 type:complete len:366 (+) comp15310_c0_seq1:188-1285(+)
MDASSEIGAVHDDSLARVRMFKSDKTNVFSVLSSTIEQLWSVKTSRNYVVLSILAALWATQVCSVASRTNSLALAAFGFWVVRDMMALLLCLVHMSVDFHMQRTKRSQFFSFGFRRIEVLAVFTFSVVSVLAAAYTLAGCIDRVSSHPEVHCDNLAVWSVLTTVVHVVLQRTVLSRSAPCTFLSTPTSMMGKHRKLSVGSTGNGQRQLPQMILDLDWLSLASSGLLILSSIALEITPVATTVDTISAMSIAGFLGIAAVPTLTSSARVLLQSVPLDVISKIEKCIREMSTFEGVLGFQNEYFWLIHEGQVAGSLCVRVRRDANEQMVLAHVTNKLAHLVSPNDLTVQTVKDDWIHAPASTPLAFH